MHDLNFAEWPCYEPDEIAAVTRVLESGKVNYWTGEEERFEGKGARFKVQGKRCKGKGERGKGKGERGKGKDQKTEARGRKTEDGRRRTPVKHPGGAPVSRGRQRICPLVVLTLYLYEVYLS
jgi:hypothetical protein